MSDARPADGQPTDGPPGDPRSDDTRSDESVVSGRDTGATAASAAGGARPVTGTVAGVLAAVVLVLAAASAYSALGLRGARADERARQDAITAARQEAVNLTSQDYSTIERDLDRMLAGATGDLKTDLAAQRERYSDTFVKNKVRAQGNATEAGLVTMGSRSATVLVVIDQTVRSDAQRQNETPQTRRYRLELDLSRIDGKWLTTSLRAAGLVS